MEEWGAMATGLKMPALDHLEMGSGVNIQCTKCSDFIVGKQTNFNGPVTIISCTDIMKQTTMGEKSKEELVIRDKILSQSAAVKMTKIAQDKEVDTKDTEVNKDKWRQRMLKKLIKFPVLPLFMFFGLLLCSGIALAVFFATASKESPVSCLPLGDNICIYSGLPWQSPSIGPLGRHNDSKPSDLPLPYVIIFQSREEFCYDFDECVRIIEIIYQKGSNRTSCSFFVGCEGNAYEGQGWGRSEGIFTEEIPTYPQVVGVTALIRYAVENNYVSKNYVLAASNATSPEDGLDSIYNIIKRWPNFSENPFPKALDNLTNRNASHFLSGVFPKSVTYLRKSPGRKMAQDNLVEKYVIGYPAAQCESLENDVNIQCVQSADFVLGKQTNFNCPVTIISCADTPEVENPAIENKPNNENIIIRNKILSKSAEDEGKSGELGRGKWQRILQKLKALPKVPVIISIGLLTLLIIVLVVCLTTLITEDSPFDKNGTYRFYTKEDWGGKPPKSIIEMKLPIPYVVISHSVTSQCFKLKTCSALIQNMQSYHMSIEYADIGYNFLLDSNGNVYEGRGWSRRNVKGGFVNGRNIDIGLIGDYSDNIHPTTELMNGLKYLIEYGVENGKISKTYSLIAANSTYETLSPGKNVYQIIKEWPHFDPDPASHVKDFYE